MRVLIFSINYWPEPTGFAPHVARFADSLVAAGDDVSVVTGFPFAPQWRRSPDDRGDFTRRETINGVDVLRVSHIVPRRPGSAVQRILMEATFCATFLLNFWRLRRRYDVVLYVGAQPAIAMLCRLVAAVRRIPYALWINDLATDAARDVGIIRSRSIFRLLGAFEYRAYTGAAGAIVLCDAFRKALRAHGFTDDRIVVVRSPVDVVAVRPLTTGTTFRQEHQIAADAFVVMFAGSMGLKQGMENVIASARVTATDPSIVWVLIGDGEARPGIERLINEEGLKNVVLLPLQPPERLSEMFAAADLLLLNQLRAVKDSVVPSKLLTYMAAGKPVVAAVNGTSQAAEIVREASGGRLVTPEDPAELARAVIEMRQQTEQLPEMGRNNRRYAEAFFDERKGFDTQRRFLAALVGEG